MRADQSQQPPDRQPGLAAALLLAMALVALIAPCSRGALAATKPTTLLKPSVQSAATGNLKSSRQALLKQRTSVVGLNARRPGKIVGTTRPAPKTIVTKRFLPK